MTTAAEYREMARAHAKECVFGDNPGNPDPDNCPYFSCKTDRMLSEAAELRELLPDDGSMMVVSREEWAEIRKSEAIRREIERAAILGTNGGDHD